MTTEIKSEKEKQILSKKWADLTAEDLRYLYFTLNYSRQNIAEAFDVTIKQVSYKLKKFGLNKLSEWTKESMREAIKKVGEEELARIIFSQYDLPHESDNSVMFGPVIVTTGEHQGRIGYLDDTEGKYGLVLWGDGPTVLDSEAKIPLEYLSNDISTYDLVLREKILTQSIWEARMLRLEDKGSAFLDDQLIELYGEYTSVTKLLNKVYAAAILLQGEGDKTVFISHASQDTEVSLMIATDLKRSKYNVWFDKWDIVLGHIIPQEITDGLDSADALIIVLSDDYLKSAFCRDEWQGYYMRYNSQNKPIIMIVVDDSKPPTILASRKYFRIKTPNDYDDMLTELKLALSKL